jgi:hypothetical protein
MIFKKYFLEKIIFVTKYSLLKKRMLPFEDFSPKQKRLALNIIGRKKLEF